VLTPFALPLNGVSSIACVYAHGCAVAASGLTCWGNNFWGQLGDGTYVSEPNVSNSHVVTGIIGTPVSVEVGDVFSCALTDVGTVWCWGDYYSSNFGDGGTNVPTQVVGLPGAAREITAGSDFACALLATGEVDCWGNNGYGQLGCGFSGARSDVAVQALGPGSGIVRIASAHGGNHTCFVDSAGVAGCWGRNDLAQLGDNTGVSRCAPASIAGLAANVQDIAAGLGHTCTIDSVGAVSCWGFEMHGELGNGVASGTSAAPTVVPGLPAAAVHVSAGENHTCVVVADGSVWCWGGNESAQIDGSELLRLRPVQALP
jgi:alpha-tubulin suppressor-like RCC1 family protein